MSHDVKCPFCLWPITAGGAMQSCPDCHVPYHDDCWAENGGCATFGCRSWAASQGLAPANTSAAGGDPTPAPMGNGTSRTQTIAAPPASDGHEPQMHNFCDQCGEHVTHEDLFCGSCGTRLE